MVPNFLYDKIFLLIFPIWDCIDQSFFNTTSLYGQRLDAAARDIGDGHLNWTKAYPFSHFLTVQSATSYQGCFEEAPWIWSAPSDSVARKREEADSHVRIMWAPLADHSTDNLHVFSSERVYEPGFTREANALCISAKIPPCEAKLPLFVIIALAIISDSNSKTSFWKLKSHAISRPDFTHHSSAPMEVVIPTLCMKRPSHLPIVY